MWFVTATDWIILSKTALPKASSGRLIKVFLTGIRKPSGREHPIYGEAGTWGTGYTSWITVKNSIAYNHEKAGKVYYIVDRNERNN